MEKILLSENLKVVTISEDEKVGVFDIEGLYRGYGLTIGNALRRVLLSSLPGAAITQVKIKGVGHEFTTIEGVMEDVVEICLNLKKVRLEFPGDTGFSEPEVLTLKAKGEGEVTAADIAETGRVSVVNKDQKIATITKKGIELEMELTIEKGLGYVAVETLKGGNTVPVGVIQLDALFSPVTKVNMTTENMRVGDKTDFNRVRLVIETDGGIAPKTALTQALFILSDHFAKAFEQLGGATALEAAPEAGEGGADEEKPKKRATKKKKEE
jgi:DNA-directed RNA polymerase subunit alpha